MSVDALVKEAIALRRSGNLAESAGRFEAALAIDPVHAGALTSYAMLLLANGDLTRAIEFGRRAAAAEPYRMSARHVLGQALCRAGALGEGIDELRRAASLVPDAFEVHLHLGAALNQADDLEASERSLTRARELAPNVAAVQVALGNLYRRQHRAGDAIAAYRSALELDEHLPQAYNNLGTVYSEVGDAERAIAAFGRALALDANRASTWSNLLLAQQRSDHIGTQYLIEEHREFGRRFGAQVRRLPSIAMPPLRDRRLRIGYVSSDFVSHAVSVFFEPLSQHHDRARFEIHCYHNAYSTDDVTERLRRTAEHFAMVAPWSDDELAERIRRDGIDILVDLNGHTAHNRLLMFLMKPAPVQVSWLGYLGTTGLDTMDYRLTDATADPPGRTEWQHTETLWRLPASLWCYQPYSAAPPVGELPFLRNGYITFGSLANPGKVNGTAIRWWSRVLHAVPESRLMLMGSPLATRTDEIRQMFDACGITRDRITYLGTQSTAGYLQRYNEVDIALDTSPYSGGTTTCDALWMGVPVVTLAGERSVSRSAASILATAGLHECVCADAGEYVGRAAALASDPSSLARLRASLRDQLKASALLDPVRFARAVEEAYVSMAMRAIEPP